MLQLDSRLKSNTCNIIHDRWSLPAYPRCSQHKGHMLAMSICSQCMISRHHSNLQGVANRDIKLENTLLDSTTRPLIKICDFGYSKVRPTLAALAAHSCVCISPHPNSSFHVRTRGHTAYSAQLVLQVPLRQQHLLPVVLEEIDD